MTTQKNYRVLKIFLDISRVLVIGGCLIISHLAGYSQLIAQFEFNEGSGSSITNEQLSLSAFAISNHFNKPERITGIHGNALRLDGYSTWASRSSFQLPGITNKLSISAWYAPEAFNKENGAIISQIDETSGFALNIGPFGNVSLEFYVNGIKKSLQTSQKIERYQWNYLVATIDLANGNARILVNGSEWKSENLASQGNIILSNATMYLGRHNNDIRNAGFLLTSLNGAIDDIRIYKSILPDDSVISTYQSSASLIPDLRIDPYVRYSGDFLRPRYHAMPNAMWTNEPYGLNYYNGKYHLFFQKNPNSPTLYFMHWGHLTSPDLVNWTEEKIALAPSPGFDSFGVWSGTTIKDSTGVPVIIYTGVDGIKAGIGTANSSDENLEQWTKSPLNPLIPNPPPSYQSMDFRDPFVWKSDNSYYMIVGSGIQNSGGGILFTYKSQDLVNWTSINPLYRNVYVDVAGYFWEMPFFYPLNDQHEYILGVTPIPTAGIPAQTIYWIGKWENEKFTPYFSTPKKIELINSLMLSPSFNQDTSGRITYIGIVPEDRDANSQIQSEWRHLYSLPRVVRLLEDSAIGQVPHPNLCRLRDTLTSLSNRTIIPGTGNNIPEIHGAQAEFSMKIKADPDTRFTLQVFKHEDSQEFTSIIFDLSINKIAFDRSHSSLSSGTPKDYRSESYVFNYRDTISIDIFLDHSIIEVFIDNLAVYSFRAYPSRIESNKADLIVNKGKVEILEMNSWKMKDMRDVNSEEICEPINLPHRFRKPGETFGIPAISKPSKPLRLYPNPTKKTLNIGLENNISTPSAIRITDLLGKTVLQKLLEPCSNKVITLNVSMLTPGSYLFNLSNKSYSTSGVFVVN